MPDRPYTQKAGMFSARLDRWLSQRYRDLNETTPWDKQGPPDSFTEKWLGLVNLLALRIDLREENLHDTDGDLEVAKPGCPFHQPDSEAKEIRTPHGTQNDLQYQAMGCRGSRFGRNVPRKSISLPELERLLTPNPLVVSERLMARREFLPARGLNLLAAAWIQFQVHDWMVHENEPLDAGKDIRVPPVGHDWQHGEMVVPRTKPDTTIGGVDDGLPSAFINRNPQWWDGSQIYGETPDEVTRLRTDPETGKPCPNGKLHLDPATHLLPVDPKTGMAVSGMTDNWWLGLELLHTLFALEHNAICDELAARERLTPDQIYQKARLINAALMAKIHTIEWTPGIIAHPSIKPALDANWMGVLGHFLGERFSRWVNAVTPRWTGALKQLLTGIPGREANHNGAPFALTEEFATVYRLHPLLPDEVKMRQFKKEDGITATFPMEDILFDRAREPLQTKQEGEPAPFKMIDALYSFGTSNPGQIRICNYPSFLRDLQLPEDPATGIRRRLDLAAVDVLRDRERGVPRYNEFLRQLRKKPVTSWEELAGNTPSLAEELKAVYNDKLEDVDTVVGMFCEHLPRKFGFSDTAFRIFILMASRRLMSDRFFTSDYRRGIYTGTGMRWIRSTGMKEVLLRHFPALAPALEGVDNAFGPWKEVR